MSINRRSLLKSIAAVATLGLPKPIKPIEPVKPAVSQLTLNKVSIVVFYTQELIEDDCVDVEKWLSRECGR